MRQEVREEWVAALRSGEYTQGHTRLRKRNTRTGEDELCCLGVLCELAVRHGAIQPATLDWEDSTMQYNDWTYPDGEDKHGAYLPQSVMDWADVSSNDIKVQLPAGDGEYSGGRESLVSLNDGGFTFPQIADMIENLEEVS